MQHFPNYWTTIDKVDFLQRKILLNSVAERQLGINMMTDDFRDGIIQQLIDLQNEYSDGVVFETLYGYAFKDFSVDKYADLYSQLNDYDKEQVDKICRLYDNPAGEQMENYYILEEYINRGDE